MVVLSGELDVATVPQLLEGTVATLENGSGVLVVDLRQLEFIDSSGCRVLASIRRRCDRQGRRCVVVCPPTNDRVYRVLDILGLAAALPVVEDLPADVR